jgi:glucose/arabinose dehydrogenase
VIGTVALVAEWAMGTVQRVGLVGEGTIDQATATTFLAGLTSPVPLATGPDGAVYVGDWGTGYIYRVAAA